MKSRIRNTLPKTIFCVNLENEKANIIEKICKKENIIFKTLQSSDGGEQVGYLCGFKGFKKSELEQNVDKQCLLFSMCDSRTLNRFLSQMRENDCSVELKAMVTATNQSWTLLKLITQLEEEHFQMKVGDSND